MTDCPVRRHIYNWTPVIDVLKVNLTIYIVLTLVLRSSEHNTYYLIFFYVAGYYLIRIENSRVLPYMESMYHPSPLYGAYRACITVACMTHKRLLFVTRHDVSMMESLEM